MRDSSPEERLLKLIRGQKKTSPGPGAKNNLPVDAYSEIRPPAKSPQPQRLLRLPALLAYTNPRKLILLGFFVSGIYLLISLIYPLIGLKSVHLPRIVPQEVPQEKIETVQGSKPLEYYLQGPKTKQIFGSASSPDKEMTVNAASSEIIKNIALVGIISGETPQAIIEDKKTQKSYYLKKGQSFGEFQVEDIQEGKIILNYRGQNFELYL